MIIRKDPASQGEISCLIVEELGGEAVAEFWKVVLQQHGFAVGRQNVHVAVERLEDVNQVRAAPGLKGVGAAAAKAQRRQCHAPPRFIGRSTKLALVGINTLAALFFGKLCRKSVQ